MIETVEVVGQTFTVEVVDARPQSTIEVTDTFLATTEVVEIGVVGARGATGEGTVGPPGPAGPPGASGTFYAEYGFASPLTTWVISHGQDTYGLVVETVDPNGQEIEGDVRYPTSNTVEVDWYYPTAGMARLFR